MTEADVQRLVAEKKIRAVTPDPETARAEIDIARRHIASAEKIMVDDSTLAFTALYDAMRKTIAAHMRSRGYRVTRGAGAHAKTGEYALVALDRLDIGAHLDEFDALREPPESERVRGAARRPRGGPRSSGACTSDRRSHCRRSLSGTPPHRL